MYNSKDIGATICGRFNDLNNDITRTLEQTQRGKNTDLNGDIVSYALDHGITSFLDNLPTIWKTKLWSQIKNRVLGQEFAKKEPHTAYDKKLTTEIGNKIKAAMSTIPDQQAANLAALKTFLKHDFQGYGQVCQYNGDLTTIKTDPQLTKLKFTLLTDRLEFSLRDLCPFEQSHLRGWAGQKLCSLPSIANKKPSALIEPHTQTIETILDHGFANTEFIFANERQKEGEEQRELLTSLYRIFLTDDEAGKKIVKKALHKFSAEDLSKAQQNITRLAQKANTDEMIDQKNRFSIKDLRDWQRSIYQVKGKNIVWTEEWKEAKAEAA